MATTTTGDLALIKPEAADVISSYREGYNANLDAIDSEVTALDALTQGMMDGTRQVMSAKLADNFESASAQQSFGSYILRTTGGEASLSDGAGWLGRIRGKHTHTGYIPQNVEMAVSSESITATINEATFLSAVGQVSGVMIFTYSGSWDYTPGTYGITVTGTPETGDTITVTYQAEVRGTITQSNPGKFVSTGWNLYDNSVGYARVPYYSEQYGFGISGTYTSLRYSSDELGTEDVTVITPVNGFFTIPGDGYIHVTGGNGTDTQIWMTWSDWTAQANGGVWEAYSETEVDFTAIMTANFPNGLCEVGGYQDEIDLSLATYTVRVGRMAYSAANLITVQGYGTDYEYDEDYIYYGLTTPVTGSIDLDGSYDAYDHGLEFFTQTEVEVYAETVYGVNLKNRLERDVLTISQQTLTENQQEQVRNNIAANCLVVSGTMTTSGSLTITNSKITDDMVVVNSVIGTPANQLGDWTVTTGNGTLTVAGSCGGSTTVTLYLAHSM